METNEYLSTQEFADLIGVSRTALQSLWRRGKGPPRIERTDANPRRGEAIVLIPIEAGLLWFAIRELGLSDGHRRSRTKNQIRAKAKKLRVQRARQAAREALGARRDA